MSILNSWHWLFFFFLKLSWFFLVNCHSTPPASTGSGQRHCLSRMGFIWISCLPWWATTCHKHWYCFGKVCACVTAFFYIYYKFPLKHTIQSVLDTSALQVLLIDIVLLTMVGQPMCWVNSFWYLYSKGSETYTKRHVWKEFYRRTELGFVVWYKSDIWGDNRSAWVSETGIKEVSIYHHL